MKFELWDSLCKERKKTGESAFILYSPVSSGPGREWPWSGRDADKVHWLDSATFCQCPGVRGCLRVVYTKGEDQWVSVILAQWIWLMNLPDLGLDFAGHRRQSNYREADVRDAGGPWKLKLSPDVIRSEDERGGGAGWNCVAQAQVCTIKEA